MAKSKTSREIVAEIQKGQIPGGNPFSNAAKPRDFKIAKDALKALTPKERKEIAESQGAYGVAVAESVRGAHRIWRKGRSGGKKRGMEKRYI